MNYEQKAREIAHAATPSCGNRPDAYKVSRPHSPACDRLAAPVAAALRSVAEEVRERAARLVETYDPAFSDTNSMLDDCAAVIRSLPVGED